MRAKKTILSLIALVFVFLLLPVVSSEGFSFKAGTRVGGLSHVTLWYACLGVEKDTKGVFTDKILKEISDSIDDVRAFNEKIKRDFGLKSGLSHRYYFHWGYNENPKHTADHKRYLRGKVDIDGRSLDRRTMDRLFSALNDEWRKRKSQIDRAISRNMSFMSPREREGLASILYSIHILGDYSTDSREQMAPLASLDPIVRELTGGLNKLFGSGNSASAGLAGGVWFRSHCDFVKEGQQAQDILNILMTHLPPLFAPAMDQRMDGLILDPHMAWRIENWSLVGSPSVGRIKR